jgi:hypothetical protein
MMGHLSFGLGGAALAAAVTVKWALVWPKQPASLALQAASALGWARQPPPEAIMVIKPISPWVITDEWVVAWAALWAMEAMLLAVWADARNEDTLYLSAGLICGALALAYVDIARGSLAALLLSGLFFGLRAWREFQRR